MIAFAFDSASVAIWCWPGKHSWQRAQLQEDYCCAMHAGDTRVAAVQDLQHNGLQASAGDGGSRLSTGQRGYLRCLLHMGHLHSQLAHVNGWAAQAPGVAFITSVY